MPPRLPPRLPLVKVASPTLYRWQGKKDLLISHCLGSGIGREVALTLASRGAHAVVCADINLEAAKQTAEKSQSCKAGHVTDYKVHALHVDVRDESSVGQMVDEAKSLFGRIDYFVNTAGVSSDIASGSHTADSAVGHFICAKLLLLPRVGCT